MSTARNLLNRLGKSIEPAPYLSTYDWSNEYRYVAQKASANPGKFDTELTPYMAGLYDAIDSPEISMVVAQKSSQIAYTETINNKIGKHIHTDPLGIIVMFPKEGAAKSFEREKLIPLIEATPALRERIDVSRSKASGNTWDYKNFDGGFLKLVSSNSPASVKSTAAPLLIVEEPDDANTNVRGQGDTLKLLEDRGETFEDSTVIFGGTPTIKNLSQVESGYKKSDQRVYMVPCHHCDEEHELDFDNLLCSEYADGYEHDVYGKLNPETAYYACPHCGGEWDDFNKNKNVARAVESHDKGWVARQKSKIAGFRFNALMSPFPGARLEKLKQKELEAKKKLEEGDDSAWIAYTNTRKGLPYEFGDSNIDAKSLEEKALDYPLGTVPDGGLILTAGVDVQHDRLHGIIRAWGRNEESWLVERFVLYGITSQITDQVWASLDSMLRQSWRHASGAQLMVSGVSLDTSDGGTSDAAYSWVSERQSRGIMGIKGSSSIDAPIYKAPQKRTRKHKDRNKAERFGVELYFVGTQAAKDLIVGTDDKTGRLRLSTGHGAMHWPEGVSPDYYEQMLGEVKAPHRSIRNRLVWQRKAGQAVEDLDCEVYALHASRKLRVHLMKDAQWDDYQQKILQVDLFNAGPSETNAAKPKKRPRVTGGV